MENDKIKKIAEASRRPIPKIVASYKLLGTDGQWYSPLGFPLGVSSTGESRLEGYGITINGAIVGNLASSKEEMEFIHNERQNKTIQNFYLALKKMTESKLQSQADYWL